MVFSYASIEVVARPSSDRPVRTVLVPSVLSACASAIGDPARRASTIAALATVIARGWSPRSMWAPASAATTRARTGVGSEPSSAAAVDSRMASPSSIEPETHDARASRSLVAAQRSRSRSAIDQAHGHPGELDRAVRTAGQVGRQAGLVMERGRRRSVCRRRPAGSGSSRRVAALPEQPAQRGLLEELGLVVPAGRSGCRYSDAIGVVPFRVADRDRSVDLVMAPP